MFRDLGFYYVRAKNFRCFGPEGIELDLHKLGQVVLIKGRNLDREATLNAENLEDKDIKARNGVGKSTIPEIICYALFGRPLKEKRNIDVVINKHIKKGCEVEVRWGKYRVVRCRKTNSLNLWESEAHIWDDSTQITVGKGTQEEIQDRLGISFETFVNTIIFTDQDKFLECNAETKRRIIEDLLSLSTYTHYHEIAKKLRKSHEDKISSMVKNYERMLLDAQSAKERLVLSRQQERAWKATKKTELDKILSGIGDRREKLKITDTGAALVRYSEAQEEIAKLNTSLLELQDNHAKATTIADEVRLKAHDARQKKNSIEMESGAARIGISNADTKIQKIKNGIEALRSRQGSTCNSCFGVVKEENFAHVIQKSEEEIAELQKTVDKYTIIVQKSLELLKNQITNIQGLEKTQVMVEKKLSDFNYQQVAARRRISELAKISKPEVGTDQRLLEDQIENLKQQAITKNAELIGLSPFATLIEAAELDSVTKANDCLTKKQEVEVVEKELPYYEFWVKAFGDKGIRKFVIDGIIPALNSRIAYWLHFLFDGKMSLTFDNELNETIEEVPPTGDPYLYSSLSRGEQQRVNLAISQSFAYIGMLNSGVSSSFVFLDEISTNVDPAGVEGIHNMIVELAKTKQVFVTTHDYGLLDILSGCETINLVKKNRFTTVV